MIRTLIKISITLLLALSLIACGGGGNTDGTGVNPNASTTPTVPTGLTATVTSPTAINLNWNASSDNVAVTGYYVYGTDLPKIVLSSSYSATNLTPDTTYCFTVSAIDTDGNESTKCNAACVTTDSPPASPWVTVQKGVSDPITNVIWTGTEAVAIVDGFTSGTILKSTNGLDWNQYPATGFAFTGSDDVAFGNGTFVALKGLAYTSTDGIAWSFQISSSPYNLNAITWSPDLGLFVAVGDVGEIVTTPDGVNWTPINHGFTTLDLYSVEFLGNAFFAIGAEGTILSSADGSNWSLAFQPPPAVYPDVNFGLDSIAWNGKTAPDSIYLAMGYSTAYISPDGVTWSEVENPSPGFNDALAWGDAANGFVTVGIGSHVFFSSDGLSWTRQFLPANPSGIHTSLIDVTWTGTRFVAVGEKGMIISSTDGMSWDMQSSGEDFTGVAWDGSQYIAVANRGRMATATTPLDWSYLYVGTDYHYVTDMTWNNDYYVAAGTGGGVYSTDRVSWNGYTSNYLGKASVVWDGTNFVMTTDSGILMWDGVSMHSSSTDPWWKYTLFNNSPPTYMHDIHWDGSLLVSVGDNGVIYTSTDSVEFSASWTAQTSGTADNLTGLTKGGTRYVAVGANGTVLTSDDGAVTWASQTSGISANLYDVTWTGSEYIAVGYSGTILTSFDGITWSYYNHGSLDLNAVVSQGSEVVIVGDKGLIVRNN